MTTQTLLKQLRDAIATYGPDCMHGLPKHTYLKQIDQAIAEAEKQKPMAFITPLMEQQLFDDWCPYKGNPDPRTVWAAAIEAVNGLLLAHPQPKQEQGEPVSFDTWYSGFNSFAGKSPLLYSDLHCAWQAAKLYTTPQQRKPLTDGQLAKLGIHTWSDKANARAIEAAHGINKGET